MLGTTILDTSGFRRREQRTIHADIVFRHAPGGEALLEPLMHLFPVESYDER